MYQIEPAAYIFTHVYMNTMQQGIQSLHVIGEFIANYSPADDQWLDVVEWAKEYKVVKILSAGGGEAYDVTFQEARALAKKYNLPFQTFIEPDNFNQMTAFGFILTPDCCDRIAQEREIITLRQPTGVISQADRPSPNEALFDDIDLIQFLMTKPSAR